MSDSRALARLRALDGRGRRALLALAAKRGGDFGLHPLSAAQRRLWLLAQMHPESATYNVPFAFWLRGPLEVPALSAAVAQLSARHASLRTVFLDADGEPCQVTLPDAVCALSVEDPRGHSAAERRAFAEHAAMCEARAPFDLGAGPPVRARLLRTGTDEALLLLTLHHIVCDGWSTTILLRDLSALYAALRDGGQVAASPATTPHTDLVRAQAQWQSGPEATRALDYWSERLAGAPPLAALPTDQPRTVGAAQAGEIERFDWPAPVGEAVRGLAAAAGTTPFAVLLAALAALIHRYCGQDDVVIGVPAAGRVRAGTEDVVGFFVNMLPLRTQVSADTSFHDLVAQVSRGLRDAQAHQELPFDVLVDKLSLPRDATAHPVFQVVCSPFDDEVDPPDLTGVRTQPLYVHNGTAKFDLTVSFRLDTHGPATVAGQAEYDVGLWDPDTVRDLLANLRTLVDAALARPQDPTGRLALTTEAQRHRLTHDWGRNPFAYDERLLAYQLVEAWADATPQATALVHGGHQLTYRTLDQRANRLAHLLRSRGVGPETLVGICLERGVDLAVSVLAVWKAGGAYVPLDPAYPADRLRYLVTDAAATLVLTTRSARTHLPDHVDTLCLDEVDGELAGAPATRPARTARPDNLAYVIYTSGSTGEPKGAMLTQGGLRHLVATQVSVVAPQPADRVLQFASPSFDASVFELVLALAFGARLVYADRARLRPGPDLSATIVGQQISLTLLPPSVAALMDPDEVPGLRMLLVGGEECKPEVAARWSRRTLVNAYGPTEATVWAAAARCAGWERRVPIGGPVPNVEVYVLDDRMQTVPRGVIGELYVGGRGIGRGYLRRPALSAERFVPDPFGLRPGARLYRTGDRVRFRADGQIEFLGRTDDQVKIRGLRVELGEIHAVLAGQDGVRTCVVAVEGTGAQARLVAYVVPEGRGLELAALRAALRATLPEFMVPSAMVPIDAVPQTTNGKIDYAALAAVRREVAAVSGPPPRTELERLVADVWRDVLGLDAVGSGDNFFDVGGNSLLIVKVRARLTEQLGRPVATLALFAHPTVRALAEYLAQPAAGDTPVPASEVTAPARTDRRALLSRADRTTPTRQES
jgi:amino acid adenylation domain-containing protein